MSEQLDELLPRQMPLLDTQCVCRDRDIPCTRLVLSCVISQAQTDSLLTLRRVVSATAHYQDKQFTGNHLITRGKEKGNKLYSRP